MQPRDPEQLRGMTPDGFAVMRNEHRRHVAVVRESPHANARRDRVYDFIEKYMMEHGGVAPLLREIAAELKVSIGIAHTDVMRLEESGRIERRKNGQRGVYLVSHVKGDYCPFCKRGRK